MLIFQSDAYDLERRTIEVTNRISEFGFPMDVPAAQRLLAELELAGAASAEQLQVLLPPIEVCEEFIPKRKNVKKNYWPGQPVIKRKMVSFNPNSGRQFADRMIAIHGWQPSVMTDGGEPSVTAAVLQTLDYEEAKILLQHKIAAKRISMLTGPKGWLSVVDDDGRLHTDYFTLGTVTGRCSHSPNIAQVPKVVKLKENGVTRILRGAEGHWGFESRALFGPPEGWLLVGADQSGLELRCLANRLAPYDSGAYAQVVVQGDAHELNRVNVGLESREKAKTLIYATIYGCGDRRAGGIVEPEESDEFTVKWIGKLAKQALIAGITGFADLFRWLDGINGDTLPGLDGRPLFARKKYARLNTILQADGAIICKRWIVLTDDALQAMGLRPVADYEFVAWVHDEVQIAARTREIAEIVADVCKTMAREAGEYYLMACPTDGEAKIGRTWAETH